MPTPHPKSFKPYAKGTRLPVPKALNSPHFFYKAERPAQVDMADVALVAEQVGADILEQGLTALQIEIMTMSGYSGTDKAGRDALGRIREAVTFPGLEVSNPTFLFCEWATPHADPMFEGDVFASLVLRTGDSQYYMTTMHTERQKVDDGYQLAMPTTSRVLSVGDFFIFDPTTPHVAAPVRGGHSSMLLLLQWEIKVPNVLVQDQLLALYPPGTDNFLPDAALI